MVSLGRMVFAGALTLFVAAPAFADAEHGNGGNGNHFGWSRSAPGPEMGVGLSALIAGGYFWYRRRKSKRDDKEHCSLDARRSSRSLTADEAP
jgi:hypothetical protein